MLEEYTSKLIERFKGSEDFFPGQLPGEKVIYFTRRHPLSFLGMIVIALVMVVAPLILYPILVNFTIIELSIFQMRILIVLGSAYFLFVLGFLLVAWIIYYFDVVIITNARIVCIIQESLFARKISEANLTDVEDVNAEVRGILQTLFHFGTVHVQTAGTAENFEFDYLPNPYRVSKLISDLHEQTVAEAETREAREIGEVIAEKTENGVTQEDINLAAQKLAHHGKTHKEIHPQGQSSSQKNETSSYQESSGWEEMDDYRPTKEIKPQPKQKPEEKPKPELKEENDNSISHDDLKKGGETEF